MLVPHSLAHLFTYSPRQGGFGIGPGLAMSRSLGDHGVAEVGVTAEPVMVTHAITNPRTHPNPHPRLNLNPSPSPNPNPDPLTTDPNPN